MPRRKKLVQLAGSGDDGSTGLLGGGRSPKDDPRIEAYGTVDEASSALGLARALSKNPRVRATLEELQRGLYALGAELATGPSARRTFASVAAADVERLEALTADLESLAPMPAEFVLPGATPAAAALDLARTVARRAERRCVALAHAGGLDNLHARRWLNRLSLLLFVLARYEEAEAGVAAKLAKGGPG